MASDNDSDDSGGPQRDHYCRFEAFSKKQYPNEQHTQFAHSDLTTLAASADRDTVLGIVDTVTQDFITYWMPAAEVLLVSAGTRTASKFRPQFCQLANRIEQKVLKAVSRIECTGSIASSTLQKILQIRAQKYIDDLNRASGVYSVEGGSAKLSSTENLRPARSHVNRSGKKSQPELDRLSNAQVLDSTSAWSYAEPHQPKPQILNDLTRSPRKRCHSRALSVDCADQADHGQAWDTPRSRVKRQKFNLPTSATFGSANRTHSKQGPIAVVDENDEPQEVIELENDEVRSDSDTLDGTARQNLHQSGFSIDRSERTLRMPGAFEWS